MKVATLVLALAAGATAFMPSPAKFARRQVARSMSTVEQAAPHGGKLVDLMITDEEAKKAAVASCTKTLELSDRQLCDTELIMVGGFSPLEGFMNEAEYKSVVMDAQLTNGLIFGLPVVFDTDDENLVAGDKVLLKQGDLDVATFTVDGKFTPDKPLECKQCYGTSEIEHPGSLMVATERGKYYVSGTIEGLNIPVRDFVCQTPAEVREMLPSGVDVVAFQCRNPVHRAHYELFTRALDAPEVGENAVVLVHPTCGPTQADDIDGTTRYKTYVVLKDETKDTDAGKKTFWAYLPYSMHMAGPREAIQHMMIRKNYGCTHFIIGRDMAGSKSSVTGDDFYGAYDAQDFAKEKGPTLGVTPVPSLNLVCAEEDEQYYTAEEAKEKGLTALKLSGTKFRKMLRDGEDIPTWFAFKSVVDVLRAEWK